MTRIFRSWEKGIVYISPERIESQIKGLQEPQKGNFIENQVQRSGKRKEANLGGTRSKISVPVGALVKISKIIGIREEFYTNL